MVHQQYNVISLNSTENIINSFNLNCHFNMSLKRIISLKMECNEEKRFLVDIISNSIGLLLNATWCLIVTIYKITSILLGITLQYLQLLVLKWIPFYENYFRSVYKNRKTKTSVFRNVNSLTVQTLMRPDCVKKLNECVSDTKSSLSNCLHAEEASTEYDSMKSVEGLLINVSSNDLISPIYDDDNLIYGALRLSEQGLLKSTDANQISKYVFGTTSLFNDRVLSDNTNVSQIKENVFGSITSYSDRSLLDCYSNNQVIFDGYIIEDKETSTCIKGQLSEIPLFFNKSSGQQESYHKNSPVNQMSPKFDDIQSNIISFLSKK
ncbi:uncharacterized protein LOC126900087 isoform X2 [Daktulosphaira vitifoliae]|uniref:uncharacterized protein LOC126900087 isoform X2 n=1 Tax=Daktulosphaira vitifoliae TaxID=58002 RepID=UPI0021AAA1E4|nr:uncharacterized protein LOC126900087 isoform X2 [Daktulosphaira vitifoliae]